MLSQIKNLFLSVADGRTRNSMFALFINYAFMHAYDILSKIDLQKLIFITCTKPINIER